MEHSHFNTEGYDSKQDTVSHPRAWDQGLPLRGFHNLSPYLNPQGRSDVCWNFFDVSVWGSFIVLRCQNNLQWLTEL